MLEPLLDIDDFDTTRDWVHVDDLSRRDDDARGHLSEVIRQLYSIGDVYALESALEELAAAFGLRLPKTPPKLILSNDVHGFAVHKILAMVVLPTGDENE